MNTKKYKVLRDGISQRDENRRLVDRAIGEVIEVSDLAAPGLLKPDDVATNGPYIEAVTAERERKRAGRGEED